MIKLKNRYLTVEIDNMGAQLTHVIDQPSGYDYIWNGQAWQRHAPILFPAIGKSNQDSYVLEGQIYSMPQHGFARDFDWQKVSQSETTAKLELKANEQTKRMFPFDFTLQVEYELKDHQLLTTYYVINHDERRMPYALGSHPAFNVPIDNDGIFENYHLTFSPHQKQIQRLGVNPVPFRDGNKAPWEAIKNSELALNHEMFNDGLIILDAKKIDIVTLGSTQTAHEVKLNFKDFPYLTLWTMENRAEPFLCIEPFAGLPDQAAEEPTDWKNKKGNNLLEPQETQTFTYSIEFK